MQYLKRIVFAVITLSLLFAVLNWPYFKAQINQYLYPIQPETEEARETREAQPVAEDRLWIRSLGIDTPIIYIEEDNEDAYQLALQNGVVHFTNTAEPGDSGNAYYFGHSSDLITAKGNYKSVFALLPQILVGDTIEISDRTGKLYVYEVEKKFVVEPDDLSVLAQDDSKKQLTLQTSYPLGTALRRYIVVAQLLE